MNDYSILFGEELKSLAENSESETTAKESNIKGRFVRENYLENK